MLPTPETMQRDPNLERVEESGEEECVPIILLLMGVEFVVACLSCITQVPPLAVVAGPMRYDYDGRGRRVV